MELIYKQDREKRRAPVPLTIARGTSRVLCPVALLLYECISWKSASSATPDELKPLAMSTSYPARVNIQEYAVGGCSTRAEDGDDKHRVNRAFRVK